MRLVIEVVDKKAEGLLKGGTRVVNIPLVVQFLIGSNRAVIFCCVMCECFVNGNQIFVQPSTITLNKLMQCFINTCLNMPTASPCPGWANYGLSSFLGSNFHI